MVTLELTNSTLHYVLMKHVVEKGYAPRLDELAGILGRSEKEVAGQLDHLAEEHGVVLHPGTHDVWVIHPFSLGPTNFLVKSGGRAWWAGCAWCSLGVVFALLKKDAVVKTTNGATGEEVEIRVENGRLLPTNLHVHFPIPMKNAWNNVIYTDSLILTFENQQQIEEWCALHKIPKGDVQPVEKVRRLAEVWYGNHLSPNWRKWTVQEAGAIFRRFDLSGPIWDLPDSGRRF